MSKILVGKQLIAGQPTPINYTKRIVSLTQSQYDTLVQQGQVEADQLYWVTDGTDSDIINDIGTSLDTTYSSQHEQALLDTKANKASTYSKAETDSLINSKLSSALKYKGIVATVADLSNIVDPDNGDSYVVTADGIMYAYNQSTSQWDALGAPMDLTNYYTKDEVDTIIEDLQIKIQYDTMPQASIDFNYPIQYIGTDTNDYKNGHFYRVVNDGTDYVWEEVIGDSKIIEDVDTLPVSNIKDMFYRLSNFEQTSFSYDTSAQLSEDTIYAMMSPYGFAKGQRYSNYLTSTSQTLQTVVMLTNPKPAFVEIVTSEKNKVNFYLYKKDSNSGWNIGCYAVDQAIDRLYLENDTITFWLAESEVLYAGNKANQTTTKVGSVDADETTIIKNQDGEISVSPAYKKIFGGTEEEFLALDVEERKKYDYIAGSDNNEIGLWPKAPTTPTSVYSNINTSSNIDYTYTVTERAFYLVRLHCYSEGQSHSWQLHLNGVEIGSESSYQATSGVGATMTLPCNVGDTIRMVVSCGSSGTYDKRSAAIYKL